MDANAIARRWYLPTPAWLVWGAAAATGALFACERWRWFPVHYQKGWPVLLALAVVAAVLILILTWMLVGLVFRRRVQFGLRTMLVFVTLCAVVCSWLAVRIKQARRQGELVATIQDSFRGIVSYDYEFDKLSNRLSIATHPEPRPLRKLLDVDFFADVEELQFPDRALADAELARVVVLARVKTLEFNCGKVSVASLSYLERLTNLRELSLYNTDRADERVKKLQRALPACRIYVSDGWLYKGTTPAPVQ